MHLGSLHLSRRASKGREKVPQLAQLKIDFLPTAVTLLQERWGHSAGISFSTQLMHQTPPAAEGLAGPLQLLVLLSPPVLDEELPPEVTCTSCRSYFT